MDENNNMDENLEQNNNIDNTIDQRVDEEFEVNNRETRSEKTKTKKEKKKNFFLDWIVPILIAFVLAMLINKFLLYKISIPSTSMVPTLNVKDQAYATKVYNPENLERGDVVIFYSHELNDTLIKRLIGLPGDDIKIVNGVISVNGEELNEDYVVNKDNYNGEFHVPEGKYFFCGDNRPVSYDSRKWQNPYIDAEDIQGKAQVKVYPFSDFGWIK